MKTKLEIASEQKFNFTIKKINRYNIQLVESIENKNVKLTEKLKSELINLEADLKKSYFGIAEESINGLYDSFTKAKDIVVDDLVKIEEFLVVKIQENMNETSNNSGISVKDNTLRLPKFELPIFYGGIRNWITFKETFLTAIHNNENLLDQLKFSYLIASVKNYLAYSLLSKFIKAKSLKSSTQKSILELLDNCNEVIRNLKSLKFEFNEFVDLILVYLIQTTFDDNLRKQWELSLNNVCFPTYEMMISFLEKQARTVKIEDANWVERFLGIVMFFKWYSKSSQMAEHCSQNR